MCVCACVCVCVCLVLFQQPCGFQPRCCYFGPGVLCGATASHRGASDPRAAPSRHATCSVSLQWANINIHSRELLQRFSTNRAHVKNVQNAIKARVQKRLARSKKSKRTAGLQPKAPYVRATTLSAAPASSARPTTAPAKPRTSEAVDMSAVRIAARRVRARKLHTVARR